MRLGPEELAPDTGPHRRFAAQWHGEECRMAVTPVREAERAGLYGTAVTE